VHITLSYVHDGNRDSCRVARWQQGQLQSRAMTAVARLQLSRDGSRHSCRVARWQQAQLQSRTMTAVARCQQAQLQSSAMAAVARCQQAQLQPSQLYGLERGRPSGVPAASARRRQAAWRPAHDKTSLSRYLKYTKYIRAPVFSCGLPCWVLAGCQLPFCGFTFKLEVPDGPI
jgi:hypothetical protein